MGLQNAKSNTMKLQTIIIISLIFYLSSVTASAAAKVVSSRNYIQRGQSISVEDTSASAFLTSLDKTFTCGFYSVGNKANAYWFSIWFTDSMEKTVVWMANRDKPINGRGSRISLRKDGAFILTDLDGSTAWQTNTTSTSVNRAQLLNSGNLVLKDPNGNILWQSFDFPTDTLLSGQPFTKNMRLVSRIGQLMFDSGYYSFFFDSDNVLKLLYDGPEISSIYWPGDGISSNMFQYGRTNYNSSRIAVLDDMGTFVSTDGLQWKASDVGMGIKRRLTLDYDGNLRLYSLNESSKLWVITWQALAKQCDVHGLCGRNGVCVYTPEPSCSCPAYFEPVNSTDWSKGCKPKFNRSHNDTQFIVMNHVDYFGYDLTFNQSGASLENCRQLCLGEQLCEAFSYRLTGYGGMCFTKGSLFNGYMSNDFQGSIYLRVPKSIQKSPFTTLSVSHLNCGDWKSEIILLAGAHYRNNQRFKWAYLYSFASITGAIEVIMLSIGWLFLFRTSDMSTSMEDGYRAISNQFRSFSYSELKATTRKFRDIVGVGGFGVVYKGVLKDERMVAVKRLGDVFQGEDEFWAEVSTIGMINHMNLARMWGFCSEGKHRLLVYEYVKNGSLEKHLFLNNNLLGWKERFKVAIGTAKGLAYLHHECLEWVIHCDIKPENILLDKYFEPKISDFGLAKLCQRGGKGSSELTRIRGTKGYMAPEWTMNLPITAKVDVYSFGVVILELVRGIRLSNWVVDDHIGEGRASELAKLMKLAKSKIQNGEDSWVMDLVDSRLEGNFNMNQAAIMIEVGLSCVEEDRNKRPSMESVAHALVKCEDDTMYIQDKL